MQMSDALDQHLASRLSSTRVLSVVLDPASADAVLTDSIDAAFWTWLQRAYPLAKDASTDDAKRAAKDVPPAGKPTGTVFLVDPRSRTVLWSTYEPPRDASPAELDRAAGRITNHLKSAFRN
jgi:hypothetical protein